MTDSKLAITSRRQAFERDARKRDRMSRWGQTNFYRIRPPYAQMYGVPPVNH